MRFGATFAALLLAFLATPALAADPAPLHGPAVGVDVFRSSDADHTQVVRLGADVDAWHDDPDSYFGVRLERAWFNPVGSGWRHRDRAYLRAAKPIGEWKASATVGTDGRTILGSATVHDEARFRKEFFLERDVVETRLGVDRGIYYTFGGAALDLPVDDRNVFTIVSGVQAFTGDNVRTHLRANYVHVLDPNAGLSLQL